MLLLNFANVMERAIGSRGISVEAIESLRPRVSDIHSEIIGGSDRNSPSRKGAIRT